MQTIEIQTLGDLPKNRLFEEFNTAYDTLDTAAAKYARRNNGPAAVAYVYTQPTALHGQTVTKFYLTGRED